jgi:F0F1-type ATP synthase assembly protein I
MAEADPPAAPPSSREETPAGRQRQRTDEGENEQRRLSAAAAGAGFQFVAAILLFVYVGQWLDQRFGTSPLWLLVGLFTGAGGAFLSLYRRLTAAQSSPKSSSPPAPPP